MVMQRRVVVALLVWAVGCSHTDAASTLDASTAAARPRYGAVMFEVGRRFELAGRAAAANKFELAAFEANEIEETFEGDLPNAELPKEGSPAALPVMAKSFLDTNAPELVKAANAKDPRAFADAFQRAAAACNACHQSSGHGFVLVPTVPGKSVPDLESP